MQYLDIAKGIVIILVVLGHAINNILTPAFLSLNSPAVSQLNALDSVIYGFHMPFFFFVAGIFADMSLRYPARVFLKKRVVRYVIPYFAWTLIVVFIKVLTPGVQNTQAGFRDLFLSPLVPFEEYWFLYVLFFLSVAYYFAMKAGNFHKIKSVLLMVSAALCVLSPFFPDIWILSSFSTFALYFVLGSYFDYKKQPAEMMARKAVPLTLAGTFAVLNVVYIVSGLYVTSGFLQSWYQILLALTGIGVTLCLAYCLSTAEAPFTRILLFCGFNSMQIYCSHQVPMGVIRLCLHRLMGTNHLWARTLIQTCATVAVCCVVFYFWPNDPYLHLILFGEPHVKNDKKGGSTS